MSVLSEILNFKLKNIFVCLLLENFIQIYTTFFVKSINFSLPLNSFPTSSAPFLFLGHVLNFKNSLSLLIVDCVGSSVEPSAGYG